MTDLLDKAHTLRRGIGIDIQILGWCCRYTRHDRVEVRLEADKVELKIHCQLKQIFQDFLSRSKDP